MKTTVLKATPEAIARAAAIVRAGGLVGMPTETVYGLAGDGLSADAGRAIFAAKGRPGDNPLIVHIASQSALGPLIEGEPGGAARRLMAACWPGPLTLIFKKSALVPDEVTAGLDTVAVRMPSHPAARALIEAAGRPIAAPSANRSGRPSPTTAAHVLADMDGRIELILDGGPCEVGLESTVVDVTGDVPRVLRPGGVTPETIAALCGGVELDGAVLRPLSQGERPRSPGMKYRHYAPAGQLTLFRGEPAAVAAEIRARYDASPADSAILALPGHASLYGGRRVIALGRGDDAGAVAAALFAALRAADDLGAAHLYSEAIAAEGVGLAVMNRLGRAAAFSFVDVP
ncbi:MAG: threonylcarbamoyl-AMP synthase [Clostridiales bacterium]|nr:threonylcarbamoyl-AMP synthase [Clostridiales bacterium]